MNGDYYIMLQGTQNTIQGRYDNLGNLASPPIQAHRTTDSTIGQTQQQQQQVVYAATPAAQGTQQWNFTRTTGEVNVAQPQTTPSTPTPTKSKRTLTLTQTLPLCLEGSSQSHSTPKASKSTPADKQVHYCRWEGCKKSFRRLKLLENHERMAHSQQGDDGMGCSTVGCDKKFNDKKQLQHHESRCELKPHRCSWEGCDKTFRTSKLLHGHISAVHRRIGRNTYKCSIPGCQQAYPDSTKLKTHEVRCKFRYETLADIKMETDAANAALLVAANAVGDVTSVPTVTADVAAVSSANNMTASSVPGAEDAMNMSMSNSSIEGNKQPASTVDLSFMVKNDENTVVRFCPLGQWVSSGWLFGGYTWSTTVQYDKLLYI
ncbi:putative zinc finger protein [Orchesella cincta]|uniref:Putative zinc finger protein n=1 Tax=Orchesella cincta TaxID=48709 RepID=A0A1D2N2R1_ORCCI|nr:putative zinc finger protein [Orchesella cincta]